MRQQGQQNRRGRSRSGRKMQNPLSRNYDSNGPDVKIRGTAAHIAEKYTSLARDALSSGDTVAAENLFQHAEHYNRIIMSAQQPDQPDAQPVVGDQPNGNGANLSSEPVDETDGRSKDETGGKKAERNRGRNQKSNGNSNRRRRRRPNGNGASMSNGAEASSSSGNESINSSPKKENSNESGDTPPNGALL